MKNAKLRLVMLTVVVPFGIAGCVTDPPNRASSCLDGLQSSVAAKCGCHPKTLSLDHALAQTGLPENAKTRVLRCANLAAKSEVEGKKKYDGELKACLETTVTLDPDARKKLIDIVDQYSSAASPALIQQWEKCYTEVLRQAGEPVSVRISRHANFSGSGCQAGKRIYKNTITDTLTFSEKIDEYQVQALADQAGGAHRIDIFQKLNGKEVEVIPEESRVGPSTTLTKKIARIRVDGTSAAVIYRVYQEPPRDDNEWGLSFISIRPIAAVDARVTLPPGKRIRRADLKNFPGGCTVASTPFHLTCDRSDFRIEPNITKSVLWDWDVFDGC